MLDGLFFGVLLGYLQHFRSDFLQNLLDSRRKIIAAALLMVLLLSPVWLLPQRNKLMLTAGLTSVCLGFGILLMLSLRIRGVLPTLLAKPCAVLGSGMATIGKYPYPIYLWHEPFRVVGFALLRKLFGFSPGPWPHFLIYLSATILVGVVFSRLMEYPILKLRDRLLPAVPKAIPAKPAEKSLDWRPDRPLITTNRVRP